MDLKEDPPLIHIVMKHVDGSKYVRRCFFLAACPHTCPGPHQINVYLLNRRPLCNKTRQNVLHIEMLFMTDSKSLLPSCERAIKWKFFLWLQRMAVCCSAALPPPAPKARLLATFSGCLNTASRLISPFTLHLWKKTTLCWRQTCRFQPIQQLLWHPWRKSPNSLKSQEKHYKCYEMPFMTNSKSLVPSCLFSKTLNTYGSSFLVVSVK